MKIFRSDQIKEIDSYTISNERIASSDLMERAALQLLKWLTDRFERTRRVIIFAGPGNNGGDGIALARLLHNNRYETEVHYVKFSSHESPDWKHNFSRLKAETSISFSIIENADNFPVIIESDIVIDALLGSGLTRPAEGLVAEIIRKINRCSATVISVDIPSGLFGEDNSWNINGNIIEADYTLSFQFPRLSILFAENQKYTGRWFVLPIGLSPEAIRKTGSPYRLTERSDVLPLLKERKKHDHKGIFGHGLLIAGSRGRIGAAVLGARAALRAGIGLVSCQVPSCGCSVLQVAIPEAMVIPDISNEFVSDIIDINPYMAVGVGPGLGTGQATQGAVLKLLLECKVPLVIDADGLNILGMNKEWLKFLPAQTILTPHPKEFERVAGTTENSFQRLLRQIEFSQEHQCIVLLKGAFTSISMPDGNVFFNSTGNPGMATAGSGDLLTGILLSLLAQGYTPEEAAVAGVFLHGLAGDLAAGDKGFESLIASDIIEHLGDAFRNIRSGEGEEPLVSSEVK
jgi:NAD(P)H-hydrate epimerase